MFSKVRVQIPLESTVFRLTLPVLENHGIFSSCFSEDDSEIKRLILVTIFVFPSDRRVDFRLEDINRLKL